MLQEYTSDINLKLAFKGPYSLNILFPFFEFTGSVRYKQDRLCHQWQTDRLQIQTVHYLFTNQLFVWFFMSLFIENRSRKVIELIYWFIWFVFFPFLKSKMKQKKKSSTLPCEKKKKKKGVSNMRPCSHHWGNQTMLGQHHLATSEPIKSLVIDKTRPVIKKCSITKWPPAPRLPQEQQLTLVHISDHK